MPHATLPATLGERARSQSSNAYVTELRQILYGQLNRIVPPDFAFDQDPEILKKMLRDTVIADAVQERAHKIAGREVFLHSDDERTQKLIPAVQFLLKQIRNFRAARYNLGIGALLEGMRLAEMRGEFRWLQVPGDSQPRRWYVVTELKDVSKHRVRQQVLERRPLSTEWTMAGLDGTWRQIAHPEHFVWHRYTVGGNSEMSVGAGTALLESLYYYWYWKTLLVEVLAEASERFGAGATVVKVDYSQAAGDSTGIGKTYAEIQSEYRDTFEKAKARHLWVIDREDSLETLEPGGTAWNGVMEEIRYIDQAIQNLLQGKANADDDVGSFAREVEQGESADDVISFDHSLLAESLSTWLVGMLWRLNVHNFVELGGLGVQPPEMSIRGLRRDDPLKQIEIYERGSALGLTFVEAEVYERLNATKPGPSDETIGGQPAAEGGEQAQGGFAQGLPDAAARLPFLKSTDGGTERTPGPRHFASKGADTEIDQLFESTSRRITDSVADLMQRVARHVWTRGPIHLQDDPEIKAMTENLRKALAYADALGEARVVRELESAGVDHVKQMAAGARGRLYGDATPSLPSVLELPFDEGISNLGDRLPILAESAQELSQRYSTENVFGMVRSISETMTRRAQAHLESNLAKGKSFQDFAEFAESLKETGFDRSYAKTVYRTNLNTSYSEARQRAAEKPALKDFIVGFEFLSQDDGDVRDNHQAAHEFRAPKEDPAWDGLSPPLGYNCRCAIRTISRVEAQRKGWLDNDGNLKRHEPRNFSRAQADGGTFGRRRR